MKKTKRAAHPAGNDHENLTIFAAVLSVNLVLSAVFIIGFDQPYGDALSRTASAYFVFFNNDSPKLTSIGSIWLPLPIMLQMPLVFFRPLATTGLAGGIISSIFSAMSVAYLNKILKLNGYLSTCRRMRHCLLGLFYFNPMILLYSINGMTEIILIAFLLGVFYQALRWIDSGSMRDFLTGSLFLSGAALVRYEGWFVAILLLPLLFAFKKFIFRHDSKKVEGLMILYALPVFYVICLWVLYNWLIMGDPLYFERGFGSFSYQAGLAAKKIPAKDLLLKAVGIFPFAAAAFVYVASKSIKKPEPKSLLALSFMGSIIGFNLLAMGTGTSFGWLRQFIYLIPFSMASLVLVNDWSRRMSVLVAFMLLASTAASVHAFRTIETKETFADSSSYSSEVASYIRSEKLDGILMDAFYGYKILLWNDPRVFVDSYDNNFTKALEQPYNYSKYIFAFDALHMPDMMLAKYPSLAKIGRPELTLMREFDEGRLKAYRIDRPLEGGIFSVENLTAGGGVVQFVLQNYDDAQQSLKMTLNCTGMDFEAPVYLEKVKPLEREEIAMPMIEGCDWSVLEVNGTQYSFSKPLGEVHD